jgi:hypothetical protein
MQSTWRLPEKRASRHNFVQCNGIPTKTTSRPAADGEYFFALVRAQGYGGAPRRGKPDRAWVHALCAEPLGVDRIDKSKGSLTVKLKRAGWDDAFLLELLNHMR